MSDVSTVSAATVDGAPPRNSVLAASAPNEKKLAIIYEFLHAYLLASYKAGVFKGAEAANYTMPKALQY